MNFQLRVNQWLLKCLGKSSANDKDERNHRFLEEALELVQSCGCTGSEAHQLVDYVFGREVGEKTQELGGVMVTLAALSNAQNISMEDCAELELGRVWQKIEKIRAKQAAKPKHGPLPIHQPKDKGGRLVYYATAMVLADRKISPRGLSLPQIPKEE